MRRNRRSQYDMMAAGPPYREQEIAPQDQLDPKDERLLALSRENGLLFGENRLLSEDNVDLEDRNQKLEKTLEDVRSTAKMAADDRDSYRDRAYEAEREVDRLRQYEPKEEKKDGEEAKDQTKEN